jgi:lysophospholipase L1-like esterase
MKSTFKIPSARILFVFLSALLLLTATGSNTSFAQTATNAVADVSQYPTDPSLLPGKGPAATWSGLPKLWAQRHAEWARTAGRDQGAVVFLGDSITQGWNSLARDFPDLHVANRGIGGDTTRGVLYRLNADVLGLKPRAVVLLIGTNDVGNGAKPDDVADNIEAIVQALRKFNPDMPVIVCRVMPRSDQNQRFVNNIEKLNGLIDGFVKTQPGVVECDTWSIFAAPNGGCLPANFHIDLLHLNANGYEKWAAALKPILAKLSLSNKVM